MPPIFMITAIIPDQSSTGNIHYSNQKTDCISSFAFIFCHENDEVKTVPACHEKNLENGVKKAPVRAGAFFLQEPD
jgi:hypothetical protein